LPEGIQKFKFWTYKEVLKFLEEQENIMIDEF
jgi:hypothetical protein